MLKNIMEILRNMIAFTAIIVSSSVCAGMDPIHVELGMGDPWKVFPGEDGVRYKITSSGLQDARIGNKIVKVIKTGIFNKTPDGLMVYVSARCIPLNNGKNISLTGSVLMCDEGAGIKLKMFKPDGRTSDLGRYHFVATITKIQNKEKESDASMVDDEVDLSTEIKSTVLEIEPKFGSISSSFDNSFSGF